MLGTIFKKKLKNVNVVSDKDKIIKIPLNSKYIKIEPRAAEPNPLGERYQDIVGVRIWLNTDAPINDALNNDTTVLTQEIKIIKTKGDILDRYEIHPNSYNLLFKKYEEISDDYENPEWFITYNHIADKELTNFTIARVKGYETPKEEGQTPFLRPNENLLLQLSDFSNITFEKVKPWTSKQKVDIEKALKKLYLPQSDIEKIREWTLLDKFEKGKVKPKSETCGIILYGPAGTGKTVTVNESLRHIFEDILDFKFKDISIGNLVGGENSGIVGGFAKTLAEVYKEAFKYISLNRKPYIIFIDEGDDLIEDVSNNTDNGSKWLHQGQVVLKNYMNPKRFPGVVFIISTNLSSETKFYEPFRNQRLGTIKFPVPTLERYTALFADLDYPESLQNKLLSGVTGRKLTTDEIKTLAKICADKITLRITANICERFNKTVIKGTGTFNFGVFKKYLVDDAISETLVSKEKELEVARENNDNKKYNEITQRYGILIRQLDFLNRNVDEHDDRVKRVLEEEKMGNDLLKIYDSIKITLDKLLLDYNSDSTKKIILDDVKFLNPLRDVLKTIIYFNNSAYKIDMRINEKNKKYMDEMLNTYLIPILTRITTQKESEGDFALFSQIIIHMPDSTKIFSE